jgi:pimeloyl-ACP methyl ester carboxylesterase
VRARKAAYHELAGPVCRRFFFYRATNEVPGAPLLVSVHGIARNAAAHVYKLIDEAERLGLSIVAPLFEKNLYGQYQQLVDTGSGARADLALIDVLDACARLSAANVERVLLFGFSGGAQFAHRFTLAHPGRVASAVLVSAGWYTFPDAALAYPFGLGNEGKTAPPGLDLERALRVPQHVMVGGLDVERDKSLRQSEWLDGEQGATRLERARRWVEAMSSAAVRLPGAVAPTFEVLPGVAHSFVDAVETAFLPRRVCDRFAADAGLAII